MAQVAVRDQVLGGADVVGLTLTFPVERITVRELIRGRVYQEVEDYNRSKQQSPYQAWAAQAERPVQGARASGVDWRTEFDRACEAFERKRVFVLIGDRQAATLDEEIDVSRDIEVTFVRLVLLAGG